MRVPQEPLTEFEVTQLRQLLRESGARTLEYARGVFTSSATSPTLSPPTEWLPMLLGSELPSQKALELTFGLLMREYNSVCDCLGLGVPVVPAATEAGAIRDFCQGYIRIVQKCERWKLDKEAFALLMPIAVLSEYVQADSLQNLAPEFADDPEAWTAKQRDELSDTVMTSYAFWESARHESAAAAADLNAPGASGAGAAPKAGRNESCPCGSGKKYKKCCGAPS